MNALLQQAVPTDYASWKLQRESLITQLKDYLLNLPESEIVSFYFNIEKEIKRLITATNDADTLQCLHLISVLYHFQRNQDITHQYYSQISAKYKNSNRLIANAISKTFFWLAVDSNEASQAFKELLDFSKKWIQSEPSLLYHSLVVLKRICKLHLSFEAIQIIFNNCDIILKAAGSKDSECQELVMKLLEFQFSHLSDEDLKPKISLFDQQSQKYLNSDKPNKIYCSIRFLNFLLKLKSYETCPDIENIIKKVEKSDKRNLNAAFELILKAIEKFHPGNINVDLEKLFCLFFSRFHDFKDPKKIFIRLFNMKFDHFPLNTFLNFIYSQENSSTCHCQGKICMFTLLSFVLKKFPDIKIDATKFGSIEPCKHYIKCTFLCKNLLTDYVKDYYKNPLDKKEPHIMTLALRLYPICPELFNYENLLKKLNFILNSSDDRKLRKQIIKTFSYFNTNDAVESLIMASLIDDDEKNRLLAISYLKPTPFLATHTNIIQYLSDSSFAVRRKGIKLISQIYAYNSLLFKPLIIDYMQTLFMLIITTTNVNDAGEYAAFLATVTKHCKFLLYDLGHIIIAVCLKVVNSSVPDNERNLVNLHDNSMISQQISVESGRALHHSIDPMFFDPTSPKSPVFASSDGMTTYSGAQVTPNSGASTNTNETTVDVTYNLNEIGTKSTTFMSKFSLDKLKMPELLMDEKKSLKEPNKSKLFLIFHSLLIDIRDAYLLKSISNLGSFCESYLVEILAAYSHVFTTRTTEDLLISAVKSLTRLSLSTYNGLNIRLRCPQIAAPLVQILSTTSNEKLAISIIKLFGSAFDSVDILLTQSLTTSSDLSAVMAHSPSYATDLAITNIMKFMGDPSLTTLKTFSLIVEGDPIYSAKFLPKIALVFHHLIRKGSEMVKNQAFQYLEIIASNTLKDFAPLLPLFLPEMQTFINLESCVHFCTLVAYFMKTEFISCSNELFFLAISAMQNAKVSLFKNLMYFVTVMIIHQNQSFDVFIKTLETFSSTQLNSKTIPTCLHLIISIAQSIDISMFTSRLVIFAFRLFRQQKANITEFLAALCIYCNFSVDSFLQFIESYQIQYKFTEQLKQFVQNNHRMTNQKIIKDYRIKFSIPRSFMRLQTEHYFIDIEYPNELHVAVWLKNLLRITITKSPSPSIRACSDYLNMRMKFIKKLFPVAFLSCWKKANVADRDHFSNIVDYVLHNHRNVNSIFFQLIQIADKALIPMKVDLTKVAELSSSHQNTMFLISKKSLTESSNKSLIKMMINVCIKMGRHATARGILKLAEKDIDTMDFANWCGELGDWSKALKIYQANNAPLEYIIHSLNNLNRYDDILKYEEEFQKMEMKDKMNVIDDFFWPYLLNRDTKKLDEVVQVFEKNWTLPRILNVIYISIYNQNYSHAQELIGKAYKMLVKHVDEYIAGDQNQIEDDQDTAEILVECQEVLNYKMKKSSSGQTTSFFLRRVKHFKRSRPIWERTIALRDIVVPISSNLQFYLKIISELRKARYFSLIDFYFTKKMIYCVDPKVTIQHVKIWWDKGFKKAACQYLVSICSSFSSQDHENVDMLQNFLKISNTQIITACLYKCSKTISFNRKLQTTILQKLNVKTVKEFWNKLEDLKDEERRKFFEELVDENEEQLALCLKNIISCDRKDSHFVACANRLAGDYLLILDPINSLQKASLHFKNALDLEPNRAKLWRRWAYANSALFSENKTSNEYANNSIKAFLKLSELMPNDSLEFASQILYILSASSEKVTSEFTDLTLSPSTVIQVLPLITSKLDHPDNNVNVIIENLLTSSGMIYFQEIYFALNLYIASKDEKSVIAQSIVDKIKPYNIEAAEDSNLLIDGLVRSALTWFEIWMHSIEEAVKYPQNSAQILQDLFDSYNNPQCDLDELFVRLYDDVIQTCKRNFTPKNEKLVWNKLRALYNSLKDRVNKLSAVFLSKISERLCTKRGFIINAPGYSNTQIESLEPVLEVLETQQHPRCLILNSKCGKKLKYLLKGNEDLRLDERLMQLFALINGIISHSEAMKESNVFIVRYAVIPLTKSVGLIKWVTGADTLHQIVLENRQMCGISREIESNMINTITDFPFIQLNSLQRLEIYDQVTDITKGQELFESMWLKSPSAAVWMTRTQRFTLTSALMSMVGHIIGLGDRHPSNIMIQRETGNIVHIDFGESFDKAALRRQFPERVPFRLTKMFINALEGSIETGLFYEFATDVLKVLRESKATLTAHLTIFVEEPLTHFKKEGGEDPVSVIDRCSKKLAGAEFGMEMSVTDQVSTLIKIASDPARYIRHYPGWCPFW
ncbi:hypothetical protein TRFO_16801 [Tritrichomonas foetus]|uniref:non-specific serine/threonine protein kinase n=1 Tax=Tritrichomonas foetus TaxID=1144522 RepID=A0A1J4KU06_9EUKA|nr:hypothetical protein TRFO_16801 [Tritrichomonas foetus]|eukprot:OHT13142.1 hypothetical protein TRFO_16801 [Tritrichomonas foetus]